MSAEHRPVSASLRYRSWGSSVSGTANPALLLARALRPSITSYSSPAGRGLLGDFQPIKHYDFSFVCYFSISFSDSIAPPHKLHILKELVLATFFQALHQPLFFLLILYPFSLFPPWKKHLHLEVASRTVAVQEQKVRPQERRQLRVSFLPCRIPGHQAVKLRQHRAQHLPEVRRT